MKPILYAKIWDEKGEYLGKCKIKRGDSTFNFKGKTFNIDLKASYYDIDLGVIKKRYYIYCVNRVEPVYINELDKSLMKPDDYNSMINTKQLKVLNNLSKSFKFDMKTILIIGGVLVVGYLAVTGQLF